MIMGMVDNRSFTLTTTRNGKGAGYDASRTASHMDLSWCPFSPSPRVSTCWRFRNRACWWRLARSGRGDEQGHGNRWWIAYFQTWKLKPSTTKTVSGAFLLNNKEAKRELKANFNNGTLPFCSEPKYHGGTLNRSLTYRQQVESLRKMLTSRVALLRQFAGSGWGSGATTLWTATLALVHSAAEYWAPVWCCSAHIRLIDIAINDALRIATGWLRPTPADKFPIPASILTAEFRRYGTTLYLACRAMEPGHLLHSVLNCPSSADARPLKSRHPFLPAAQQLISSSDNNNIRAAHWSYHQWNA